MHARPPLMVGCLDAGYYYLKLDCKLRRRSSNLFLFLELSEARDFSEFTENFRGTNSLFYGEYSILYFGG
jgi:hypothetical protein